MRRRRPLVRRWARDGAAYARGRRPPHGDPAILPKPEGGRRRGDVPVDGADGRAGGEGSNLGAHDEARQRGQVGRGRGCGWVWDG